MRKLTDSGTIDRRILILFRILPQVLEGVLPGDVRPREIRGCVLGGIALSRRRGVRTSLLPVRLTTSHNAVHFLLVDPPGTTQRHGGTLVTRCDTSSRLQAWIGGHGIQRSKQHHARFRVSESKDSIELVSDSDDHAMHLAFKARIDRSIPRTSFFRSSQQAYELLRESLVALGLTPREVEVMGEPRAIRRSRLHPLIMERLESSVFSDARFTSAEAVQFDSAFWLRDDEFAWSGQGALCCDVATA